MIALNLFITYFLLLSTSALLHRKPRRLRLILGAVFGGFSALLIFAEALPFYLLFAVKLLVGTILVLIAFPYENHRIFIKTAVFFFLVNIAYGGFMFALWLFVAPSNMYYRNGVAYFNLSALLLCLSTVAAYFFIKVVKYLLDRRIKKQELYQVVVTVGGNQALLSAFYDSGNRLKDPFSGYPILVCEFQAVKHLLPEAACPFFIDDIQLDTQMLPEGWKTRVRIVPFQVVKHTGTMKCFLPDSCLVINGTESVQKQVLIGISDTSLSDGEYNALLPADILNL